MNARGSVLSAAWGTNANHGSDLSKVFRKTLAFRSTVHVHLGADFRSALFRDGDRHRNILDQKLQGDNRLRSKQGIVNRPRSKQGTVNRLRSKH